MLRHLWKAGLALVVLTVGLSATAEAQYGIGQGVYSRGVFQNNAYRYNNYVQPHTTYYGGGYGYNYYRAPVWYNTPYYNYYRGGYGPYVNHYQYVPRYYNVPRTLPYYW